MTIITIQVVIVILIVLIEIILIIVIVVIILLTVITVLVIPPFPISILLLSVHRAGAFTPDWGAGWAHLAVQECEEKAGNRGGYACH